MTGVGFAQRAEVLDKRGWVVGLENFQSLRRVSKFCSKRAKLAQYMLLVVIVLMK